MKHTKLFEEFLNEADKPFVNKNAEMLGKIADGREKTAELRNSLQELGEDDEPNAIKMAIMQLNIEKQNLKNQMLRLDGKITQYKDKLVKQEAMAKAQAENKKAKEAKLKRMQEIAKERATKINKQ